MPDKRFEAYGKRPLAKENYIGRQPTDGPRNIASASPLREDLLSEMTRGWCGLSPKHLRHSHSIRRLSKLCHTPVQRRGKLIAAAPNEHDLTQQRQPLSENQRHSHLPEARPATQQSRARSHPNRKREFEPARNSHIRQALVAASALERPVPLHTCSCCYSCCWAAAQRSQCAWPLVRLLPNHSCLRQWHCHQHGNLVLLCGPKKGKPLPQELQFRPQLATCQRVSLQHSSLLQRCG